MYAAKLFALLAAFLSVSQVDARKRKHKKEKKPDAVIRYCNTGEANFVVDGITQK